MVIERWFYPERSLMRRVVFAARPIRRAFTVGVSVARYREAGIRGWSACLNMGFWHWDFGYRAYRGDGTWG